MLEYKGEHVGAEELKRRKEEYKKDEVSLLWSSSCQLLTFFKNFYYFDTKDGGAIDSRNTIYISKYTNHSCEPNCLAELWEISGHKRIRLVALRAIRKGDPVEINYHVPPRNNGSCQCGSDKCQFPHPASPILTSNPPKQPVPPTADLQKSQGVFGNLQGSAHKREVDANLTSSDVNGLPRANANHHDKPRDRNGDHSNPEIHSANNLVPSRLIDHIQSHSRKFPCKYCPFATDKSLGRHRHEIRVHERPEDGTKKMGWYRCKCGKVFPHCDRYMYKKHRTTCGTKTYTNCCKCGTEHEDDEQHEDHYQSCTVKITG